jgi:excisionase family DNA binding protein
VQLIDIRTLSRLTNVKVTTLYSWVRENRVPHYKIGALIRFQLDEIKDWLKKNHRHQKQHTKKHTNHL